MCYWKIIVFFIMSKWFQNCTDLYDMLHAKTRWKGHVVMVCGHRLWHLRDMRDENQNFIWVTATAEIMAALVGLQSWLDITCIVRTECNFLSSLAGWSMLTTPLLSIMQLKTNVRSIMFNVHGGSSQCESAHRTIQ